MKQPEENRTKEKYMLQFENFVVIFDPTLAGKIHRDSAEYFYDRRIPVFEAARKYVISHSK